jgi:hypothetical protein
VQVLYKDGNTYIVKVSEGKYYYGNGTDRNGFGVHPVQFLKFNPYLEYVAKQNILVPKKIKSYIESHIQELEKVPPITNILKTKKDT